MRGNGAYKKKWIDHAMAFIEYNCGTHSNRTKEIIEYMDDGSQNSIGGEAVW